MRNIKLTISYDGTNYSGWQIQPNAVTIQELIQNAVRQMTSEANNVVGAGRTDRGVHALAQVAAFRTEKAIPLDGFRRGLNSTLPGDIRILAADDVELDFHPIRNAKAKHYSYLISEAEYEHPLYLNRSWCIGRRPAQSPATTNLNVRAMNKAAVCLVGEHDFSAFRAADGCDENPVRRVFGASIDYSPPPYILPPKGGGDKINILSAKWGGGGTYRFNSAKWGGGGTCQFNIAGDGFLKNMVRNIVGTLLDVGLDKITPAEFEEIMASKDRKKAGVCAPASGLYLVSVEY